jgi:hypothetical protein
MEIDELFGLPAHALLVHIPVVMIPVAFGVALLALWPRVRWWAAVLAALLAVVGGVGAFLAVGAGEWLKDHVAESDLVEEHADNGEAVELPAIAFAVVAVAGGVIVELRRRTDRRAARPAEEPVRVSAGPGAAAASPPRRPGGAGAVPAWAATAVLAVSAVVGGYTTYTVVEAGHSGSKAVWDGQVTEDGGGSGGGDEVDDGGQGRGQGRGGDDPDRDEGGSGESDGGY